MQGVWLSGRAAIDCRGQGQGLMALLPIFPEPLRQAGAQSLITSEAIIMSEEKKEPPKEDVPAHSTEQEKQRLKDFNKDGIPPGSS
jgi:hypothetical protein